MSAARDVLMLRFAHIRIEKSVWPVTYDQYHRGYHHVDIVEKLGGELVHETNVYIKAYFRVEDNPDYTMFLYDLRKEWLPPSFWRRNPITVIRGKATLVKQQLI